MTPKKFLRILPAGALLMGLLCLALPAFAAGLTALDSWCADLHSPTRIAAHPATHLLYVSDPRAGSISVFTEAGVLQNTINTVAHPSAIAVDSAGHLFVADHGAVRKLSADGTLLSSIGETPARLVNPHDLAVARDGRLFVADVNDSIKVFDAAGNFLSAFGGHGYFAGRLDDPVSLLINNSLGELYVADQNNSRISVFNLNGTYLRAWGALGNGNGAPSRFLRLWGLAADSLNRIWAYDDVLSSLQVFGPDGASLANIHVTNALIRTGVDIEILGDKLYLTAQSSHCVLVYRISESTTSVTLARALPLNLTIAATPQGIVLRWNRVPGVNRYQVICSSDAGFSPDAMQNLGSTADSFMVDASGPAHLDRRFYQVIPMDGTDNQSRGDMPDLEALRNGSLDTNHDSPHTIDYGVNCTSCHFSNFAYPNPVSTEWLADQLCKTCHVETGKAQPEQNHASSSDTLYCTTCHSPHFQQAQYPHGFLRTAIVTPHSGTRAMSFNNATDFVHGAPNYDGICEVCHTTTSHWRNNSSGDHGHNANTNCLDCHKHLSGFMPAGGGSCNACHESPPATPAHLAHVGNAGAGVGYGDLRKTSDFGDPAIAYNFGCGNCHPGDMSRHNNGVVDVELYNASAPDTTLKAKNPAGAAYTRGTHQYTDARGMTYTDGTCSNVYCHSSGGAAQFRTYATANWGRTEHYGCNDCHGEPPRYDSHSIGGAGANSHYQFNLYWGYEDIGHVQGIHWYHDASTEADSSATVINCNTCHYGTTTSNLNTGLNEGQADCGQCHTANTIPPMNNRGTITNYARHVSGSPEISFSPLTFRSAAQLSTAPLGWTRHGTHDEASLTTGSSYDPQTKTCSNVACHLDQRQVQWGYWGTDFNAGCECHNMSSTTARAIPQHSNGSRTRQTCADCHTPHQSH
ncbi:MAG TPA: CxxxxCH/CxxCH domain-containing protein [bacterium]|jgi:predicted CxxxxCH...CXXCH cytochrome family protein